MSRNELTDVRANPGIQALVSHMRVVLLRVGIDSGCGGIQGPLFRDGSFEFLPIPDTTSTDSRTYGNTVGLTGRHFVEFFPRRMRSQIRDVSMHVDPEWTTYTYGDPTSPKAGLRRLQEGDILAFYAGLEGWDFDCPPALYLVGYFLVSSRSSVRIFTLDTLQSTNGTGQLWS